MRIVRLQVQADRLKQGEKPHRWYDPSNITPVDRLWVDDDGSTGEVNGKRVVDIHNVHHPRTRNHGRASGLSVGFTAHYRNMRQRFGPRVVDGVAGENVLVDSDDQVVHDQLDGAVLRTSSGDVPIVEVEIAEPCVEFSRFVLGIEPGDRRTKMREPLQQLMGGVRGYYVALAEPAEITVGDSLVLPN